MKKVLKKKQIMPISRLKFDTKKKALSQLNNYRGSSPRPPAKHTQKGGEAYMSLLRERYSLLILETKLICSVTLQDQ